MKHCIWKILADAALQSEGKQGIEFENLSVS